MKQMTPFVSFDQLPILQQHSIIARLEREIPDAKQREYVLTNYRAIPEEHPTAIFSLSMTKARFIASIIAEVCSIDEDKLLSGVLAPQERKQIEGCIQELLNQPIWIDDTPALSIAELKAKAFQLVREQNVKAIYIDDIQFLSDISFDHSDEKTANIMQELKTLATELNIPVVFGYKSQVIEYNKN